jgi:hypothetical protein
MTTKEKQNPVIWSSSLNCVLNVLKDEGRKNWKTQNICTECTSNEDEK